MSVVSYRLYCDECDEDEVIKERNLDESEWVVQSVYTNSGVCPECSQLPSESDSLNLDELDGIGETAAENLREAGYDTTEAIAAADDNEILAVSWVGQEALFSLKEVAKQHPPQKRW